MLPVIALAVGVVVKLPQQVEPAVRRLTPVPIAPAAVELVAIGGVRELPDGRILVSDAGAPALYVIDPQRGSVTPLGREGRGPNEYGRPGGIYPDADGGSFVLDRTQPRVLVVDRNGILTGMRSIEVRGFSAAADRTDPRRVDGALHSYFVDPGAAFRARADQPADSLPLLRFDIARQRSDTVAMLGRTRPTVVSSKDRMTISRTPIFSPADGWGIATDGSVALVRSVPYRVEWVAPGGQLTRGAPITYTPVPVTATDREAREGSVGEASIGQRTTGGRTTGISTAGGDRQYAKVKPAFDPEAIIVAPEGRLWVGRHAPANARETVYDVFDRTGARVDRVALPARTRVVGFGPGAVYGSELDADDVPHLRKFRLTN